MTWLIVWAIASLAFAFGWALGSTNRTDVPHDLETRRMLLDWGETHRLLDHAQIACEHRAVLPRVRFLLDFFLDQIGGWPTGTPPEWPTRNPPPPGPKPPAPPPPPRKRSSTRPR